MLKKNNAVNWLPLPCQLLNLTHSGRTFRLLSTYFWRTHSICILPVVSWLAPTRRQWLWREILAMTSECWSLAPDLTLQATWMFDMSFKKKKIHHASLNFVFPTFCGLVIRAQGASFRSLALSKRVTHFFRELACVATQIKTSLQESICESVHEPTEDKYIFTGSHKLACQLYWIFFFFFF